MLSEGGPGQCSMASRFWQRFAECDSKGISKKKKNRLIGDNNLKRLFSRGKQQLTVNCTPAGRLKST